MAIDEVENWEIVAKDNPAPLPAGPPGAKQKRIALSFTEIMASIARWRDSLAGIHVLTKIIDIGDWDMPTDLSISVTHGLTFANIRSVQALIRNDADTLHYDFASTNSSSQTGLNFIRVETQIVKITQATSSLFNSTDFDATSYNRGWITIQYVA